MKIAVLGTRGIPALYSGFETCVQETSIRFLQQGHSVRVYCRHGKVGAEVGLVGGVELVETPYIPGKHLETLTHTMFSTLHLSRHPVDAVHVYGTGNGWFVPLLRLFCKRIVFLVDGLDWKRTKWGPIARSFLRLGGRVGSKFSHVTAADSVHVISVLQDTFPGRHFEYVPYGANVLTETGSSKLEELGLKEQDYYLFVGRFVPEKNVHLLVKGFERAETRRKLVLVGGNSYDESYERHLRTTSCERIFFPGFVFGKGYEELLRGCYAYIQPSALEGTSPSLLAAMGAGACVLVSDIPENQETVGEAGFFFKTNDVDDLARRLTMIDSSPDAVQEKRVEALFRVKEHYSWDLVSIQLLQHSRLSTRSR